MSPFAFLRARRGAVTVEAAIALSMLVLFVLAPATGVVVKLVSIEQLRTANRTALLRLARADPFPVSEATLDSFICRALHNARYGTPGTDAICRSLWRWQLQAFETPEDMASDPPDPRPADEGAGQHNDMLHLRLWLASPPVWLDLFSDPEYVNLTSDPATGRLGPPVAIAYARAERAITP